MSEQQTIEAQSFNNAVVENTLVTLNRDNTQVTRDEKGHWLSSGNPGGRPKARHISEELRAKLESGDAETIGSQLIDMAKDKSDKWLALAATKEVIDRTEGKAMQRAIVGVTVDPRTLEHIAALAEKLLG